MNHNTPPTESVERMIEAVAQLFRAIPQGNLTGMEAGTLQALCLTLFFKVEFCASGAAVWPDDLRQALAAAIGQHLEALTDVSDLPPEGLEFMAWYSAARAQAVRRDAWPDVIGAES